MWRTSHERIPARAWLIGVGALGAVVLSSGCVRADSASSEAGTTVPHASPGWSEQKIDVGGVSIAVSCEGQGAKTVVLISGLGEDAATAWRASAVPGSVAQATRVCTYDRPGLGESAAASTPRTVTNHVHELDALVKAGALPAPLVVVGQGYGTFIARQYAHDHIRDLAGLVLIDPPLEVIDPAPPPDATPGQLAEYDTIAELDVDLGAFGAGKLPTPPAPTIVLGVGDGPSLPPGTVPGGPTTVYRTAAANVGSLPVHVPLAGDERRAGQQQLARKSPFGSFRYIKDSGSFVQYWNPDAVVDAVVTVVNDPRSPK